MLSFRTIDPRWAIFGSISDEDGCSRTHFLHIIILWCVGCSKSLNLIFGGIVSVGQVVNSIMCVGFRNVFFYSVSEHYVAQ